MENECVGCGCTDHNACVVDGVACHWLIVDHVLGIGVCSCCQGSLSEFTKEQERIVDSIENLKGITPDPDALLVTKRNVCALKFKTHQ